MKISTKGRYSVTALYELALRYGEGAVSLKSIATSQGLSENYLEQLMAPLRRAGIVKSVRGAQGGYRLACRPDQVTVGTILTALEGNLTPSECTDAYFECPSSGDCVAQGVWVKIKQAIDEVVDHIYLADLVREHEQKNAGCIQAPQ